MLLLSPLSGEHRRTFPQGSLTSMLLLLLDPALLLVSDTLLVPSSWEDDAFCGWSPCGNANLR